MLSKLVSISSCWPPSRQVNPPGSAISAICASMSTATPARSRPARFAVIVATRSPSARRISAGPVTSSTEATAESGIAALPPSAMFSERRSSALSR